MSDGPHHHDQTLPPTVLRCRVCGSVNNGATSASGSQLPPADGDVSLCLYCAGVSVFTGWGLATRPPTPAELADIERDPDLAGPLAWVRSHRTR